MTLEISSPRVIIPSALFVVAPNLPLFIIMYYIIAKANGYAMTKMDYIAPGFLFFVIRKCNMDLTMGMSLFMIMYALLRKIFPQYY